MAAPWNLLALSLLLVCQASSPISEELLYPPASSAEEQPTASPGPAAGPFAADGQCQAAPGPAWSGDFNGLAAATWPGLDAAEGLAMEQLRWNNTFTSELPADREEDRAPRQVQAGALSMRAAGTKMLNCV